MTLSTGQQTELEKPVTRAAYFVEFHFSSGVQYLSSMLQTITWGGHDWIGLGSVGNIDTVEDADSLTAKALNFTLNVAQTSWLALADGDVAVYRGLVAKLYMCPLDEQFRLVGTPAPCWNGIMDTMSVGVDNGGGGQIILKCETAAYGLKRRPALRMNAAQQKKKYPGDTGLDLQVSMIGKPQTWLSVNFQRK